MSNMNSPADWLLVIKHADGTKGYINLWDAIEQGRLIVKTNPVNRAVVTDACADCSENRRDIDTNFGTKESTWYACVEMYSGMKSPCCPFVRQTPPPEGEFVCVETVGVFATSGEAWEAAYKRYNELYQAEIKDRA